MRKIKKVISLIISVLFVVAPLAAYATGWNVGTLNGFGLPAGSIQAIIFNIMVWMLGIFGAVGIIGFAISGIIYLTAAGDEGRIESAKRAMSYSIIGVIVGISGLVILQAADTMLNALGGF